MDKRNRKVIVTMWKAIRWDICAIVETLVRHENPINCGSNAHI